MLTVLLYCYLLVYCHSAGVRCKMIFLCEKERERGRNCSDTKSELLLVWAFKRCLCGFFSVRPWTQHQVPGEATAGASPTKLQQARLTCRRESGRADGTWAPERSSGFGTETILAEDDTFNALIQLAWKWKSKTRVAPCASLWRLWFKLMSL